MPKTSIPESLMLKFSNFLAEMMGLYFPPNAAKELEKKLQPVAKAFEFQELSDCLEWLMKAPLSKKQIAILAHHLTIGETYFFRDQRTFALLENDILPKLIQEHQQDKSLRIWSAACCTGEEAYSIAILLNRMIPDIKQWHITLLGTDINHVFLRKAEIGQYKQWSFRATSKEIQDRYFHRTSDGSYDINPQIKNMVQFTYLNLVEDCYPDKSSEVNNMDLILCNNVLIYFSHKHIQHTVSHLSQTLVEGGWLIVTPIESPYVKDKKLHQVNANGCIIFQKASDKISSESDQHYFMPTPQPKLEPKPFKNEQTLLTIVLPSFLKLAQPTLEFNFGEETTQLEENLAITRAAVLLEASQITIATEEAVKASSNLTSEEAVKQIQSLANAGLFEEAQRCCEQILRQEKLNPVLHYLHATILQSTNHIEEAIQSLKRVVFLDSTFIMAHFMLGTLTNKQGNKTEAKRHFRNCRQLLLKYPPEATIPGTEDTTAGTILNVIHEIM